MLIKTITRHIGRAVISLLILAQLILPLQTHAFSIGEERMVGEKLLYTIRTEFKILDDPDIAQYINDLGQEVLSVIGPQYFDYHFFVVKSDQFNAFAAPSGLIFFYTGLIKTMKNEDELLSVLAHEIGHAVSRHISHRISKQGKVTAATTLLALASLALGNPALTQGVFAGSLAANQAVGLSFSRQDEEQADRLSFDWMRAMNRNPESMEGMLRTMRRVARYRTNKLPAYLLTHPNPEDRLFYVQSLIEIDKQKGQTGEGVKYKKTDNFAFLRFKYRVLSQSIEPEKLRIFCANTLASGRDPEQVTMAHYGLALLSAEENNFPEAIKQLEIVRKKYPDQAILNVDLGTLYLLAGQTDQAVDILRKAYQRNSGDMYAAFQLAMAVEKKGDTTEAQRLYNELARAMPDYSRLYYELGRLKANLGENGISNFYLAKYYLYEGRIKYAKQYLKRSTKDKTVPAAMQQEAETILERLKTLEEET